ncbi:hypothetical protein [Uliginosibacterium aquaticum]|uniref:YARHG domain-containing protein n=1 Tax=Uliginosibacterium aquaticum TaxID=2731212 RepID=A0ABX2IL96_9RHOO|nr:hypothetical protein [Uliginosibacterium aquaticum]NSL55797.1 hypothetical protein [Uliginosibacterium aquaticum]
MLKSGVAWLLLMGAQVAAAEALPSPGQYGFDWLKPETTRCVAIKPALIARFKHCSPADVSNAFGLDFPGRACRVSPQSEYMVYATRKQCQEALETMQANAP